MCKYALCIYRIALYESVLKLKIYIYLLAFLRFRSFSSAVIPCNDFSDDDVDGLIDEDCAKPAPSKCVYQYI